MVGMHRAHPESAELIEVTDEVEVMTAVIQSWSKTHGERTPGAAPALPRATVLSDMNLGELRTEAQRMGFDITLSSLRTKAQLHTAIKDARGAEAEIQELREARGLSPLGTKDLQEQEAMEMGRAPSMTKPEHLPPAGSPRVLSPHQRDVDLPATP